MDKNTFFIYPLSSPDYSRVSMASEEIPPQLVEKINRFNQLRQTLEAVVLQRQQIQADIQETQTALGELNVLSDDSKVYTIVGKLLIMKDKQTVSRELSEKMELLKLRDSSLEKQESKLREKFKELQEELSSSLAS